MRRRGGSLIVAVAALAILAYITVNTVRTKPASSTGPSPGSQLPPFAAPLVLSDLSGDANVATRPNQGGAGRRPACDVADPRALNICALARRSPVVLAFFVPGDGACDRQLDAMQRLAPRYPQVAFAAVSIKGSRGELRTLTRRHGWTFPVAQDADGAVMTLYGVAVCPTVVFAARGGRVVASVAGGGIASEAALERKLRELLVGGASAAP